MAYTAYDKAKPVNTQTGNAALLSAQTNLNALRDMIVLGSIIGWDYTPFIGTGSSDQPEYITYDNGTEAIRAYFTWGTSGGADGNVTQVVYKFSTDSGSTFPDTIGTCTYTYTTSGTVTTTIWS